MGRKLIEGVNDLYTWCVENHREDLLKEWDDEKNGEKLTPKVCSHGSTKLIWWKCLKGHRFQSRIVNRVHGTGCPFCSGRIAISGINDLATTNSSLLSEWDYSKNKISPSEIAGKSGKKVWWICSKKHEYESAVYDRANGKGCPYCAGKKVLLGYNDLQSLYPEIAEEWDYDKNPCKPSEIMRGSSKKFWWICKVCGNEWYTDVNSRTQGGTGCPVCGRRKQHNKRHQNLLNITGSIEITHKQLLEEWDFNKNTVKPSDVTSGTHLKVWWLCGRKHSYLKAICDKVRDGGCPICAKECKSSFPEQVVFYYIKKLFPDTINGDRIQIYPLELDIYIPSKKTAIEYDGHIWHKNTKKDKLKNQKCLEKGINLIRIREFGCPDIGDCIQFTMHTKSNTDEQYLELASIIREICMQLDVKKELIPEIDIKRDETDILSKFIINEKENSLLARNPEFLREWNYNKNGDLSPESLTSKSQKRVWWICKNGHEWQSSVSNRYKRSCPYCTNQKVLSGCNDLATKRPDLLSEWDYAKNEEINVYPDNIAPNTKKKIWWRCGEGHSYQMALSNRSNGRNCPYCSGKKVLMEYNDFASNYPELLKEWDYQKNGWMGIEPTKLTANSGMQVWWLCPYGHSYKAYIGNRTSKKTGCPICSGKQVLQGYNDLASRYPQLLKEWDYEKNKIISPNEVYSSSNLKVWWICPNKHHYKTKIYCRTKQGTGCPYCTNHKVLAGYNDIETLYPHLVKEWDYENNKEYLPKNTLAGSSKKIWWICAKGHHYEAQVNSRTQHGTGCPYCAKRKLLVGFNDLATLHPEIAKEWDYDKNGDFKPTDCIGGLRKVWWLCPFGHSYEMDINSRTSAGHGCPICARKEE